MLDFFFVPELKWFYIITRFHITNADALHVHVQMYVCKSKQIIFHVKLFHYVFGVYKFIKQKKMPCLFLRLRNPIKRLSVDL